MRKIIEALEEGSPERTSPWTSRGYLLNQGVLYRYTQDDDTDEAQLVIPEQERTRVLKENHDSPTAGHYGVEHTLQKIRRYHYWPGMRNSVAQHVKACSACQRYKPSNLKPAGPQDEKWILITEDYATRWVELFALTTATAFVST